MNKYVPGSFQNTTGPWWQGAMDEQKRAENGQFGLGNGTKVGETEHHEIHDHGGGIVTLKHKGTGNPVMHPQRGKYEAMNGGGFPLSFSKKEQAEKHSNHFGESSPSSKEIKEFHSKKRAPK